MKITTIEQPCPDPGWETHGSCGPGLEGQRSGMGLLHPLPWRSASHIYSGTDGSVIASAHMNAPGTNLLRLEETLSLCVCVCVCVCIYCGKNT